MSAAIAALGNRTHHGTWNGGLPPWPLAASNRFFSAGFSSAFGDLAVSVAGAGRSSFVARRSAVRGPRSYGGGPDADELLLPRAAAIFPSSLGFPSSRAMS